MKCRGRHSKEGEEIGLQNSKGELAGLKERKTVMNPETYIVSLERYRESCLPLSFNGS